MRIVLHEQTVSVLWPFAENRCRWTFQWSQAGRPGGLPAERPQPVHHRGSPGREGQPASGATTVGGAGAVVPGRDQGGRLGRGHPIRASSGPPIWPGTGLAGGRCGPSDRAGRHAEHEHGNVRGRGPGRQTETHSARKSFAGPIGNLPSRTPDAQWEQLLGLKGAPKAGAATDAWVRQQCGRLLPCLPAPGGDLSLALAPVGTGI